MLRRRAMQLARNPDAADDLVQDTLMLAWAARDGFDGRYMGAWLLRIMRNRFISLAKRPKILVSMEGMEVVMAKGGKPVAFADSALAEDRATALPDERLHAKEIVALINLLPPIHREALEARVLDGVSDEEMAQRLGVAIGTVKSRIYRARAALAPDPQQATNPNYRWKARSRARHA
jgi:RNA polymerase sigma-70 factor (ECF subfamily)